MSQPTQKIMNSLEQNSPLEQEMNHEVLRYCILCESQPSERICQACLQSLSPLSVACDTQWRLWENILFKSEVQVTLLE